MASRRRRTSLTRRRRSFVLYRLVNHTRREVYHGIAIDPTDRFVAHCIGKTKALSKWRCDMHHIEHHTWNGRPLPQTRASQLSHHHERTSIEYPGYKLILTRGI